MIRNSPQHIAYYNMQSKQKFIEMIKQLNVVVWVLVIFYIVSMIFEKLGTVFSGYGLTVMCVLYCYYYLPKKRKEN